MEWTARPRPLDDRVRIAVLVIAVSVAVTACGASKTSLIGTPQPVDHPVRAIALTSDDVLSRAIGVELTKQGYTVADPQQTAAMLMKRNAGALELMTPEVFAALSEGGVDVVVAVDATPGVTGHLQRATVTATSTLTSRVIGAVGWRNAWGGAPGSPADAMMRKGVSQAAEEIVQALSSQLPAPKK